MDFNDLVFINVCETQLKFRILYIYNSFRRKDKVLLERSEPVILRFFLKLISLTSLKEVLSGKFRHRLVLNYFKKVDYETTKSSNLKNNILFLDSSYLSTVAIINFYNNLNEEFY